MRKRKLGVGLFGIIMAVMMVLSLGLFAACGTDTPPPPVTLSNIAITTVPTRTAYTVGDNFDPAGMVVTATLSNSTTEVIPTTDLSFTPSLTTALATTHTSVTVSYTRGEVTRTVNQAITVTAATVSVESVTLNQETASIVPGGTVQLEATVLPPEATNRNVTWSSSNEAAATVSPTGLVTGVAPGTATITVTTVDGEFTAEAIITVTPIAVTGVQVDMSSVSIVRGQTQQIVATVQPANATNQDVEWESDDELVATVDGNGLITAVAVGTATITVTTDDGGIEATVAVTVTPVTFGVGGLRETTVYTIAGDLVATENANYEFTLTVDEEYGAAPDPSAVTISVTVAGTTDPITLTGVQGEVGYENVFTFTLPAAEVTGAITIGAVSGVVAPVTGIEVDYNEVSIIRGNTRQINATVLPTGATNQDVEWESDDELVATVDGNGLITAVAVGTATITVTTDEGGIEATVAVTVTPVLFTVTGIRNETGLFTMIGESEARENEAYGFTVTVLEGNTIIEPVTASVVIGDAEAIILIGVRGGTGYENVITFTISEANVTAGITIGAITGVRLGTAITNVAEFVAMTMTGNYFLANNIDFEGATVTPIGGGTSVGLHGRLSTANIFSGTLNGDGFTLSNIVLQSVGYHWGLFRMLDGATIQNINIVNMDAQFSTGAMHGMLAGWVNGTAANPTIIENVYMHGVVTGGGTGGVWLRSSALVGRSARTDAVDGISFWTARNNVINVSATGTTSFAAIIAYAPNGAEAAVGNRTIQNNFVATGNFPEEAGAAAPYMIQASQWTYARTIQSDNVAFAAADMATTDFSALVATNAWSVQDGILLPQLTANAAAISEIEIATPEIDLLQYGDTLQLEVLIPEMGRLSGGVEWVSSDTEVATVSSLGLVTATLATGEEEVVITALSIADNGIYHTVTITVSDEINVTSIELSGNPVVFIGQTTTINITLTPSNATSEITWNVSGEGEVDYNVVAGGLSITGAEAGQVVIVAENAPLSVQHTHTIEVFDPLNLTTPEEFQAMDYWLDGDFALGATIDFEGFEFDAIGGGSAGNAADIGWGVAFTGSLDGNGFALLNITSTGTGAVNWQPGGLFRQLDGARVENLAVINMLFTVGATNSGQGGSFVGRMRASTIENVFIQSTVVGGGGDWWGHNSGFIGDLHGGENRAINIVIDGTSDQTWFLGVVAHGAALNAASSHIFYANNDVTRAFGANPVAAAVTGFDRNAPDANFAPLTDTDYWASVPGLLPQLATNPVDITAVEITTEPVLMVYQQTLPLEVNLTPLQGVLAGGIEWISSNDDVATVSAFGLVTATLASGEDTVTITVRSIADNLIYDTIELIVSDQVPVTGIVVSGPSAMFYHEDAPETVTLYATMSPDNTTSELEEASWSSDCNGNVITMEVAADGLSAEITAVAVGEVTITVEHEGTGIYAEFTFEVVDPQNITTPAGFLAINSWLSGSFALGGNIDFEGERISQIGGDGPDATIGGGGGGTEWPTHAATFTGIFDGRGFALSNFETVGDGFYHGLFRQVSGTSMENQAVIRNLAIVDATMMVLGQGGQSGVLAGRTRFALIENILISNVARNRGDVTGGGWWTFHSALIGVTRGGTVINNVVIDVTTNTPHLTALVNETRGEEYGGSTNRLVATNIFFVINDPEVTGGSGAGNRWFGEGGAVNRPANFDVADGDVQNGTLNWHAFVRVEIENQDFSALDNEVWDLTGTGLPTLLPNP